MAAEQGIDVDEEGFRRLMAEQRAPRQGRRPGARRSAHARPLGVPLGARRRAQTSSPATSRSTREADGHRDHRRRPGCCPRAARGRRRSRSSSTDAVLRRGRRPAAPTGARSRSTPRGREAELTVVDVQQPLPGLIVHRVTVLSRRGAPRRPGARAASTRPAGVGVAQPLRDAPAARGAAARARRHRRRRPAR